MVEKKKREDEEKVEIRSSETTKTEQEDSSVETSEDDDFVVIRDLDRSDEESKAVDEYIRKAMNKDKQEKTDNPQAKHPIYQSWQLTKMKYKFTRTEKNLFLKIVEVAQKHIRKEYLGKDSKFQMIDEFEGETPAIQFPIRDLMKDSHNYDRVRDSLESLFDKKFGLPKDESWDFDQVHLFSRVQSSENRGLIRVVLTNEFWKAFSNLKVFKVLDPALAYNFESIYTARIYEWIVGNKVAVTYDIVNLKSMLCLEDTYTNNNDFIKRVVVVAQKEMKEMPECPFYFEYDLVKVGKKIDKVTFRIIEKESRKKASGKSGETSNIVLSEEIIRSVKKLFRTDMRVDLEEKLKKVIKLIGEKKLASELGYIYERARALKEKKELKTTYAAYLSGALDKMYEQEKDSFQEKKKLKMFAQDVQPIEEKTNRDGYVYFTRKALEDKAKMSGFDNVEEFMKQLDLEVVDANTWRMKE